VYPEKTTDLSQVTDKLYHCNVSSGCDCMVVKFTTTCAISAYHHLSLLLFVYSLQHYVIKFVSDLRQVGGFLRIHQFPPLIKLTATI
jgi:hypothetical protein